jgi:hypothetical protein
MFRIESMCVSNVVEYPNDSPVSSTLSLCRTTSCGAYNSNSVVNEARSVDYRSQWSADCYLINWMGSLNPRRGEHGERVEG